MKLTKHAFTKDHPNALAVYCSDGRFTEAVEELGDSLGHPRLDVLCLPGGPALLDLGIFAKPEGGKVAFEPVP